MKQKQQFSILKNFFEREAIDYAVIGAFALHAYGYTRMTRDIDFLTRRRYQAKIVGYLETLGFETLSRSEGFSNHLHPMDAVRFDFVYVDENTADVIFRSAQTKRVSADLELPVVGPEHLILLKLFAVQNEPARKLRELADIREIYRIAPVDKTVLFGYFKRYGLEEYFEDVTRA